MAANKICFCSAGHLGLPPTESLHKLKFPLEDVFLIRQRVETPIANVI